MLRVAHSLVFALLISGCAYNNTVVPLDFKPPQIDARAVTQRPIVVETLTDQRGKDPLVLGNKGVQYKTSGLYTVTTPVATIVTNALRDTLTGLSYRVDAQNGELTLSGELLRLDAEAAVGFWSGELTSTVQVALKLTNRASGDLLWTETFTGFGKETGLQIDHEGHRKIVTEAALADLVTKVASSPSLKQAITRFDSK